MEYKQIKAGEVAKGDTVRTHENHRVVKRIENPDTWVRFHFTDGTQTLRDCRERMTVAA